MSRRYGESTEKDRTKWHEMVGVLVCRTASLHHYNRCTNWLNFVPQICEEKEQNPTFRFTYGPSIIHNFMVRDPTIDRSLARFGSGTKKFVAKKGTKSELFCIGVTGKCVSTRSDHTKIGFRPKEKSGSR